MADKKISALPAATTPLAGTEVLPVVQGGVTDQVSVANLTSGRDVAVKKLNPTDNVVMAAGKGIDFSANSNAPGMTSELLTWYEEGTWTPSLQGSSTAGTYELATASGWYTRIGRQVTVIFDIKLAAVVTGGGAGFLCIAGLPFNCATTAATAGSCVLSGVGFSASAAYIVVSPRSVGSPQLILQDIYANAGSNAVDVSTLAANDVLQGTLTYLA